MAAILKFVGYILLKWLCFFIYQYAESQKKWDLENLHKKEDVLYTLWMFLSLPVIEIIIFALPFQLALKQKGISLIIILILCFVLEFAVSWYATNQQFAIWMLVKIILSIGFFYLFYRRQLSF
jgi:hypothetical protein